MNALARATISSIETTKPRDTKSGTVCNQTVHIFVRDDDKFPEKTQLTLWQGESPLPVGDYTYDLRQAFFIDAKNFNKPALRLNKEQLVPVTQKLKTATA